MSINPDTKITVGNYQFSYNEADVRRELAAKSLTDVKINEVLQEIQTGNLSTLTKLGLANLVGITVPNLDAPGKSDLNNLNKLHDSMKSFNMLDAMLALFEAGKELRTASREGRLHEMEMAKTSALNAAEKIRSSAMFSLVFGCVSGSINVGMGVFGTVSSTKQLAGMKNACTEFKSSKLEMKQTRSDLKLAESQSNLKDTKVKLKQEQARVDALENRAKVEGDVATAQKKVDSLDASANPEELSKAKADLKAKQAKQAELDKLDDKAILGERKDVTKAEIDMAKENVAKTKDSVAKLETEVKGLVATAEKANLAQDKQLDKELKNLKSEKAAAEKSGDTEAAAKAQEKITSLDNKKSELADLRKAYVEPTSDNAIANVGARSTNLNKRMEGEVGPRFNDAKVDFDRVTTEIQTKASQVQSLNSLSGGVSQIIQSIGTFTAEGERADGAEDTAEQQEANARMDDWSELQKSMGDLIQSAMETLKQYSQSMNQINSAIFQNM